LTAPSPATRPNTALRVWPVHGGIGFIDQGFREGFVHAALGHAPEVGQEVVAGVRGDVEGVVIILVEVGDQVTHLLGAVMDEAETGARIPCIAAVFRFRRLFQHNNALSARIPRRNRGLDRSAAAADHDDIAGLVPGHVCSPCVRVTWFSRKGYFSPPSVDFSALSVSLWLMIA